MREGDIGKAIQYRNENNGRLDKFKGGDKISNQELLSLDVDVLIPAALENAITDKNASKIKAKIIVEGANGPTSHEADAILQKKGIIAVPDILANAGGVIVSYFEWVQNLQQFKWTEDEVNKKLEAKMVQAFKEVHDVKMKQKIPMRIASFMVAIDRVERSYTLRGG